MLRFEGERRRCLDVIRVRQQKDLTVGQRPEPGA
jgi:hypothetical protein